MKRFPTIKYLYIQKIILLIIFTQIISSVSAQEQHTKTRILIVLDGSRSMLSTWGSTTKMYAARQIINQIADSVEQLENVEIALRIFGHQSPQTKNDCEDTKLEVNFQNHNATEIKSVLNNMRPQGVTPLAYSLSQTIPDFKNASAGDYRNVLLIITDGAESCGQNPCAVIQELKELKVIMKSYVLGLNIDESLAAQFECLGEYINMETPAEAKQTTSLTLNKIFNSTSVRINLLDNKKIASETDVPISFYIKGSSEVKYNLYHTMDPQGEPDTFSVDPAFDYDLQFHTIPPLFQKNVSIDPFILNVITESTPQGKLHVAVRGESQKQKINCILKKGKEIIDVQNTSSTGKYLVGQYDLEILTLPVIKISNVLIEQDKTTTVEIPAPGYVTFIKGAELFGGIYLYENNVWVEIYEFTQNSLKETLALQPGKYKIIYRYKGNKSMALTKEFEIEIITGTSITQKL